MSQNPSHKENAAALRGHMTDVYQKVVDDGIAEISRLRERLDAVEKERDNWKANHDNQVKIKQTILDRPDLQDRAKKVKDIIAERDQLRLSNERLREDQYRAADLYHSLSEYAEYFGAIHADDCSQDDTCQCIYKPVNEGISCLCVMLANWKRPIALTAESGTEIDPTHPKGE